LWIPEVSIDSVEHSVVPGKERWGHSVWASIPLSTPWYLEKRGGTREYEPMAGAAHAGHWSEMNSAAQYTAVQYSEVHSCTVTVEQTALTFLCT